uniref:Uncharacterized protein n=1 Tax=Anguilla anguilla TaxID=7936 RepID=A0A0E9RCM1_ANGAN
MTDSIFCQCTASGNICCCTHSCKEWDTMASDWDVLQACRPPVYSQSLNSTVKGFRPRKGLSVAYVMYLASSEKTVRYVGTVNTGHISLMYH